MLQVPLPRAAPNDTELLNEMKPRGLTTGDGEVLWGEYRREMASEVVCPCREVIALD
jgi:hypothetical protein